MSRCARQFQLPGIEDLTKEQDAVLALPTQGRHLVIGGPGTGKTVVCLLRARRHAQEGRRYMFLVWNRLLHWAANVLFEGELQSRTWRSWFGSVFWSHFKEFVPKLPGDEWKIDWQKVHTMIESLPEANAPTNLPPLVIDEGQDMPPDFYDCLNQLGYEHIFVVADQNQQITEDNSSRHELEQMLCVNSGDVIELADNHRSTYSIGRLARDFYTGDPASPPPDLPLRGSTIYTPRLYSYYVDETKMPKIARYILRHWDQDCRRLIGVIAPNNWVRERYFQELTRTIEVESLPLDNGTPRIETYHNELKPNVRFDEGGILVINAQACKGLEFDTVVLADIDKHRITELDVDATKKLFYVMVSRARERVVMFMNANGGNAIEAILPEDPTILRREDI